MINNVHPEWVGKTLAFLNFELPAYEFDTYTSTYSAPEMYAMLDYFANEYPYSPTPRAASQTASSPRATRPTPTPTTSPTTPPVYPPR